MAILGLDTVYLLSEDEGYKTDTARKSMLQDKQVTAYIAMCRGREHLNLCDTKAGPYLELPGLPDTSMASK